MHRILVIGAGSIGERHIRCFQRTGRADVAVCEIDDTLRTTIAERYGLGNNYASLDCAIGDGFDAAVICTPAHLHIPMAMQLVEGGIGVLIEKPLSISLTDVDKLTSLVEKNNVAAGVAYVTRHHPALQALRQFLATKPFGRPVQIVYTGGQHFPFYRPAYREIYYTRHETGGGAIQDALTHIMNAAEWLVGPVTRLVTDAEHCVLEGVDVEDTVHVLARHDSIPGTFSLNQHQPVNESTLTVLCESGAGRFEGHRSRWLTCNQPDGEWKVEEEFSLERDDLFVFQADSFLDQLEGKIPPSCTLQQATQTLKVNLAALESARNHAWVIL